MKQPIDVDAHRKCLYISVDCESNGPCPGLNSMLSLGAVAMTLDKYIVGRFSANLLPLPDAAEDPETMTNFWAKNPAAWEAVQVGQEDPGKAMVDFSSWLATLRTQYDEIVFVGHPVSFDQMFVCYYLHRFVGPHFYDWLDIKSYCMGARRTPYKKSGKTYMPKRWFSNDKPHNHIAVDDALEQGSIFINALRESLALKAIR